MSEDQAIAEEGKPLSPLQVFFAKVATVTVAVVIILYAAVSMIESSIDSRSEDLRILKGGPAFWATVENKLYKLADEPDLQPEKKKKIVDALRKLSSKYRPYFEALGGENAPGEVKSR